MRTQTHDLYVLSDSPVSLCRWGLWGHPPGTGTGQSQTLCIPDYYWPRCCGLPNLYAHSSYPTGTSCLPRCRAACPPAGSLWTGRHWAGKGKEAELSGLIAPTIKVISINACVLLNFIGRDLLSVSHILFASFLHPLSISPCIIPKSLADIYNVTLRPRLLCDWAFCKCHQLHKWLCRILGRV